MYHRIIHALGLLILVGMLLVSGQHVASGAPRHQQATDSVAYQSTNNQESLSTPELIENAYRANQISADQRVAAEGVPKLPAVVRL
jgi:hypothetical protein